MTGTLQIFSNGPTPSRNAIIEDISSYLSRFGSARTITFPRISLNMDIKLSTESQQGNYVEYEFGGNYCEIDVADDVFYFFIERIIQVSPGAAELSLRMDVLNSFQGRYSFSPASRTIRRHKDRFTLSVRRDSLLDPIFDDKDEGVFPPLRKVDDVAIRQVGERTNKPAPSWFKVIYSYADTDNNMVYNKIGVAGNLGVAASATDLQNFAYIHTSGGDYPLVCLQQIVRTAEEYIKISRVPYCPFSAACSQKTIIPGGGGTPYMIDVYTISGVDAYYTDDMGYLQSQTPDPAIPQFSPDVSDEMMQLIVLNQHFALPRVWLGEAMPMMSNAYHLKNQINIVEIMNLDIFATDDVHGLDSDPWDIVPDPKIYTSPFYQVRFNFLEDFFSIAFEDLTCDPLSDSSVKMILTQYVSTNMDADVMFKGTLDPLTAAFKRQLEDYPFVFTITSKTEIPLISDAYINYMRNGYNYDVAQQKRSVVNSWVDSGTRLVGGIASLAFGNPVGIAVGIKQITSFASSIYSNVSNALTGEEEIARRIKTSASQKPTISTLDSGLNWILNDGLVHKTVYQADDDVRASLNRFFHLFGYVTDEIGDPSGFFHTRFWFNFVMGDYIIEASEFLVSQYIEELQARYKEGVTIYHHDTHNNMWDYEQQYFNTELSLLD